MTADRRPPTVAQRRFAEVAAQLEHLNLADRFTFIPARLRAELPLLLRRLGVRSLLDVPCGDFHWMSRLDLTGIRYIGGDIVDELVRQNRRRYEDSEGVRRFVRLDLTEEGRAYADKTLAAWDVRRIRQCWPSPRAAT